MSEAGETVENDEVIFRRVSRVRLPSGQVCYEVTSSGIQFSHAAFNDAHKRPSVDRACLCDDDPHHARESVDDGIVALVVSSVRQLTPVVQRHIDPGPPRREIETPLAPDVIADPIDGNDAHAVIVTNPLLESPSAFKRLKEALARLATAAGWRIEPGVPLLNEDAAGGAAPAHGPQA